MNFSNTFFAINARLKGYLDENKAKLESGICNIGLPMYCCNELGSLSEQWSKDSKHGGPTISGVIFYLLHPL